MRIEIKDKKNFMNLFNDEYPSNQIDSINGISIDSRNIMNNDIFFPIKGKKYDGHDFIDKIIENKSIKYFSENKKYKDAITCSSAKKEIIKIAKIWRKKTNAKIIAITGSNGKTTIKELLYHIISTKYQCSKSEGNFNSSIGLPLTFLSSFINDEFCILELGASFPNEIKFLSNIIKPDLAVITNISKTHIGNFKSFKELIKTKNQIFNNVELNGEIFINIDDKNIKIPKNNKNNISITSYSFDKKADVTAKLNISGMKINHSNKNKTILIDIPREIIHLKNIILSTYAITSSIGIDIKDFQNALKTYKLPHGRGQIINFKNCQIIDDSYNANPSSMEMGINRLSNLLSTGRKIAVLGDMLELGNNSIQAHELIGKLINSKRIEIIFTYGELMKTTYKVLDKTNLQAFHYIDYKQLYNMFHSTIKKNDLVYIKGSRSMQLERLYL